MIPSPYQQAIYQHISKESTNLAVNAVAGSGKTTTGIDITKLFNSMESVIYTSFSKRIVTELEKRIVTPNCEAMTYNKFGNKILYRYLKHKPKLDQYKTENILKFRVMNGLKSSEETKVYYKIRNNVKRIIGIMKNMYLLNIEKSLPDIIERFDLSWNKDHNPYLFKTWEESLKDTINIDFDDQKFLPLYLGFPIPRFDNLIIDEYQDTCTVETLLIEQAGNRIVIFGDPDQAIYGFKGTTPAAMSEFLQRHSAVEKPLSVCYRCSKNVVLEAKKTVERIEYSPSAIEGVVDEIKKDDYFKMVKEDDFVICRVTSDLVASCLKLIRDGRQAYVEGRELGHQFLYLIESVQGDAIETFYANLQEFVNKKIEQLSKLDKDIEIEMLQDKVSTIEALLDGCDNVKQLKAKVEDIFKDNGVGVRHLTIHKVKGLEADRVFFINAHKIPHKKAKDLDEEKRLLYVGRTRAKKDLFYVR